MKQFLLPAVVFLASLLIGAFAALPLYRSTMEARDLLARKEVERQTKESYLARLRSIEEGVRGADRELAAVRYAIPDTPHVPQLFADLQAMASSSGLLLRAIGRGSDDSKDQQAPAASPESEESAITRAPVTRVIVSMGLSGSYESLKEFLRAVNRSPRLLELRTVGIGSGEQSSVPEEGAEEETGAAPSGRLQFSIDLAAFSY